MSKAAALHPVNNYVILRPVKGAERVSSGGIVIAGEEANKTYIGEVVAVGGGKYLDGAWVEPHCTVGDRVLFDHGREITYEGEKLVYINGEYIIALIRPQQ
jgi:co-chaperonin GroES (HSP10)